MRAIVTAAAFAILAVGSTATASELGDKLAKDVCMGGRVHTFASQEEFASYKSTRIAMSDSTAGTNSSTYSFTKSAGGEGGTCHGEKILPRRECSSTQAYISGLVLARQEWGVWDPC